MCSSDLAVFASSFVLQLCPQRGCSGTFQLDEESVGKMITCRKCGSVLSVEPGGHLRLLSGGAASPSEDEPAPPRAPAAVPASTPAPIEETSQMSQYTGEERGGLLPVILFGVGAVVVIVFLFLPLTDVARIQRKRGNIELEELRYSRSEGKVTPSRSGRDRKTRVEDFKDERPDRPAEKTESRGGKKNEEDAEEHEKKLKSMKEELEDASLSLQRSQLFYTYGMLLGFLLLAVSSVLFLAPGQSRTKRVVGAIVITTQMLLVFFSFLIRSNLAPMMVGH